jgi:3-oxoacyl-[acyl-carrier-protein] synthase III
VATSLKRNEPALGARLTGLGVYRASKIVRNEELVAAIDSSDEWIQERSGIQERRMAGPDETVVTMGAAAAKAAIADAGIPAASVDLVI